jgi:hypothetical protein
MARITKQDLQKIDRPGTIGDIEKLAGIEDRAEFWKPFYKPNHDYVAEGVKALREIVIQRVRNNQLCIL